jgi:hypothetical protein
MILFVARSPKRRSELRQRQQARRALIAEIVGRFNRAGSATIDPVWASGLLLALEDGYRLHRLIDPQGVPADSFFEAVSQLQQHIQR